MRLVINSAILSFSLMALSFVDDFNDEVDLVLDDLLELLHFTEDLDEGISSSSFSLTQLQTWCLNEDNISSTSSNHWLSACCSSSDNNLHYCWCTSVSNLKTSSNCPKFFFTTIKFCFEYCRSSIMLHFLINLLCNWLFLPIRTDLSYWNPFSKYFLALLPSPSASFSGLFFISWWLPVWSTTISSFVLVKLSTHLFNPSLIDILLIKFAKLSTLYYLL